MGSLNFAQAFAQAIVYHHLTFIYKGRFKP